ncbi:MAG TPA: iron ABC transporter permease [Anaeromyxobacter sp.]
MSPLGPRLGWIVLAGALAVALAFAVSCALGAQPISLAAALGGLEPDRTILLRLRVPRAVLAAIVGAALAGAGVALQALLRNALAEPFVLGVSGGAALGGTIVIVAATIATRVTGGGHETLGATPIAAGAIVGAAATAPLVFGLGRMGTRGGPETAILVGVVFNAFAAGVITLLRLLVPPDRAARLLYWLLGTIGYESGATLAAGGAAVACALVLLMVLSARLNLLTLVEEEAASLGVNVRRERAVLFLVASAATGAAVALAGMVGFVGLIVPHVARRIVGPDHRLLVPASALFGAAFLVLADALARLAFLPLGTEPPVGAVTALLGGPFFLWLLGRRAREDGAQ